MTWEAEQPKRAAARVAEVGGIVGDRVKEISGMLHTELTERIEELQGDPVLVELLGASVEGNIETVGHVLRYDIDVEDVTTPAGAREYSRRLAQHGVSPNALIRAYRLGQHLFLEWAFGQIAELEDDPAVAYAAAHECMTITFRYIDSISEQVVLEYEEERANWLAHRSTVRTEVLEQLLAGDGVDPASAESALGYRLRQRHLGGVVWSTREDPAADVLGEIQRFAVRAGRDLDLGGSPLLQPRDRTSCWVWFPLGHAVSGTPSEPWREALDAAGADVRVALGVPRSGIDGFRVTHEEAMLARQVAVVSGDEGSRVVTYADPGLRTAAMLAADLPGTRRLVESALGGLAEDTEAAARLRETLAVFLEEKGSFVATAERLQVHKNTVKYRVDKAGAHRGRPIEQDRLELELALVACAWLGPAVLPDRG